MRARRSFVLVAWVCALSVGLACSEAGEASKPAGAGQGAGAGSSGASAGASAGSDSAGAGGAGTGGSAGGAGATAGVGGAPAGSGSLPDASLDGSSELDGSEGADAGQVPSACEACATYAAPMRTGTVEPTELNALSGLASSRSQAGIFFAHNDRNRPVVYALDSEGRLHARISLEGAPANDIEDIAVGPCGAETCVFLADIGDNSASRGQYAILRFVEPTVPDAPDAVDMAVPFERFAFRYEDGSHNAEGLMVAPDGTLYVVTKLAAATGGPLAATGVSHVYRLEPPFSADDVATATEVATLPIPMGDDLAASAAAAHPCGLGFLVRTYDRVYEFRIEQGAVFESAFAVTPEVVAMPDETQSEGIDYLPDGHGFVTSGEGMGAPIMQTGCE